MMSIHRPEKGALEERIRRLELQLEIAARRELASVLALGAVHDTHNLLAVARSALRSWVGDPGAAARVDAVHAVDHAALLLHDVLRLAQDRPEPGPVDVNDVVLQVVPLARHLGGGRARIDLYLRGPLPRPRLDELDLERVLLNLLANAAQASPEGAPIRVETASLGRVDDPRRYVAITVADGGAGMSPEARHHALDTLYSGRPGGTGLGLALVRVLVARHHGLLELESQAGRGTTVRVWWPVAEAADG